MNICKSLSLWPVFSFGIACGLTGCSDGTEPVGYAAERPSQLVSVAGQPPDGTCLAGSVLISIGIDDNGDGVLQPEEVRETERLCHGESAYSGPGIDVLGVYGAGLGATDATIRAALADVGIGTPVALWLRPVTWTLDADLDMSAYANVTFILTAGSLLEHGAHSVIFGGPIDASDHQIFSGAGQVSFAGALPSQMLVSWFGDNQSSGSIQKAVDALPPSGGTVLFTTATHIMSIANGFGVKIGRSNVRFRSTRRTRFLPTPGDTDGLWFSIGAADDGSFVQVHDISFEGLVFEGSATSTSVTQAAIHAMVPSQPAYTSDDGSRGISVRDCDFSGFTMGIFTRGTGGLEVDGCRFGDNVFIPTRAAGGYGVLMESCANVWIHHNTFWSALEDRHAIYVSIDQARAESLPCEQISITDNVMHWSEPTFVGNHFKNAIAIRATRGLTVANNQILGSGVHGIGCNMEDGDGSDYMITGNRVEGVRNTTVNESAGIAVMWNAQHRLTGAVIRDNTISADPTSNRVMGISFSGVDAVIGGNIINGAGNMSSGIGLAASEHVVIEPNIIHGNNQSRSGIRFTASATNVVLFPQQIDGVLVKKIEVAGTVTPLDITYRYPLVISVASNGTGGITYADDAGIVTSVASDPDGAKVTFNELMGNMSFHFSTTPLGASLAHYSDAGRSAAGRWIVVGSQNAAGTAMPLATTAQTFEIVLLFD